MNEPMSIVIPVYNRAKELPRTVASVVAQTYRPLRLILVDNHSSDNSLAVCHELQEKYRTDTLQVDVVQELKRGASAARNKGLSLVESRHVMFFDSDDTLEPQAVSLYMEAFAAHPDVDIVGCTMNFCNEENKKWLAKAVFSTDCIPHLLHGTLSTQRFAALTDVVRAVGGWEEEYNGWVDWNLGVRLLLHTQRIHWIKKPPLVTQYLHENSITAQRGVAGYSQFYQALLATRRDIATSGHRHRARYDKFVVYRQVLLAARILRDTRRLHDEEARQYGRRLYQEALHDTQTSWLLRGFYRLCYHYTAMGGRGTGSIAQYLIR